MKHISKIWNIEKNIEKNRKWKNIVLRKWKLALNIKYRNNNYNIKSEISFTCSISNCSICINGLRPDDHFAISPTNGRKYSISPNINCENCGIYAIKCPCSSLYTGKTTTSFGNRFNEHFSSKSSSVYEHCNTCTVGREKHSYSVQFLENVFSRGKYTLSEREYLWNERLRGLMNVQKTLKK